MQKFSINWPYDFDIFVSTSLPSVIIATLPDLTSSDFHMSADKEHDPVNIAPPFTRPNTPEWNCVIILNDRGYSKGSPSVQCLFCDKIFHATPTRIRAHVLSKKGAGVTGCPMASHETKSLMNQLETESVQKKHERERKRITKA